MRSDIITLSVLLKSLDAIPQKDLPMPDVRKLVSATSKLRLVLAAYRPPYEDLELRAKRGIWDLQAKYAKEPESRRADMEIELQKLLEPINEDTKKLDDENSKIAIEVNLDKNDLAFVQSVFETKLRPNIVKAEMALGIAKVLGIPIAE